MINPKHHGKGIGKKLAQHRIKHLNKNQNIELIIVRTTQLVYKFYEKMGFKLVKIEKDFWANV
jgi:ribosomal protein S18 acetylase RimI-like enzyme